MKRMFTLGMAGFWTTIAIWFLAYDFWRIWFNYSAWEKTWIVILLIIIIATACSFWNRGLKKTRP